MKKSVPLDEIALRMAHSLPFDYAYCKLVLDAWGGDESAARNALRLAAATNSPAPVPGDFIEQKVP